MKQLAAVLLVFLALAACLPPPQIPVVAPGTLAAETMAARPKTNTPVPTATTTQTPTPTPPQGKPTPAIDLALPGAYCLPTDTPRQSGLVSKVIDSNTIEVVVGYDTLRVRYIGAKAPNISPPPPEWQGPQSLSFSETLVNGQIVTLVQDTTDLDAEGYSLRYVLVGNAFVNYELVRQGLARAESMPPNTRCDNSLLAAQVEALNAGRGVWIATPVPTYTITPTPLPTIARTPTNTVIVPCNCTGPRLSCNNFPNWQTAQTCYQFCRNQGFGDIFGMDKNGNGIACDSMRP
jgi:endonuclease YncB( thermonuclease family)